jgi:hypothetical protein
LKKVLIISPYFPPANAADMQRIRMSLPYYKEFGWEAEVVTCLPQYYDGSTDNLLLKSLPTNLKIHYVKAFSKKITRKIGLGSLALRSIYFFRKKVNQLLTKEKYDLIYFSTTQFPVCILGAYWKKKFRVPYVIDMQDPWHSDYYLDKPKNEQPPKFWFSYRLNKFLEPIAMKHVDGLIAVSSQYNIELVERYKLNIPTATITFGAFDKDIEIAKENKHIAEPILFNCDKINVGYIGRGGHDMREALELLFKHFNDFLNEDLDYFNQFHFNFIGTSYAPKGKGQQTVFPLAKKMKLENFVEEQTDRIPFYQTLNTLIEFDILFICGSNDKKYTASKIYPYLMLEKPLLAIFHEESSAVEIINKCSNATVITFQDTELTQKQKLIKFLKQYKSQDFSLNKSEFKQYTAKSMTLAQVNLFKDINGNS